MNINWRWPEDPRRGIVPWFIILRRLIFWIPLVIALGLGWLSVLCGFGLQDANRFWRNAT